MSCLLPINISLFMKQNFTSTWEKMVLNCSICSINFAANSSLRKHYKTFHPDKYEEIMPKKVSSNYKCQWCDSTFTRGTSLRRHHKIIHPCNSANESILPLPEDFKCNDCDKCFTNKINLKQHERNTHKKINPARKLHKCVFCDFHHSRRKCVVEHYVENHHVTIESEELIFKGRIEFENWKKEMEEHTSTFFVKIFDVNEPQNGYKKLVFVCNRSGCYRSKGGGVRKLRNQGSLKINGICPAEITVQVYKDNKYIVEYVRSHCGHKNDYKDRYLTKDQREAIAVKIAAGVPFRVILDEVRDSSTQNTEFERANRLSRKDLYNIAKCFELKNELRVPVDGLSIEDWVNEMSERNTVIYYKFKGSFCNIHVDLLKDDFVLVMMNKGQREILEKFASNCICIDRTHYLNNDKMELISLFVLDDDNKGLPCAFLISNRIDAETIFIFYSCIKEKIGKILETNIFMSDLEDIFYSLWLKVMSKPQFRFFCPWHVEKAWRDNLQRIKSRKVQSAVYDDLKCLQQEEDLDVFTFNLVQFIDNWMTQDTLDFIFYFQVNFQHNHEAWAEYYKIKNCLYLGDDLNALHVEISKLFVFGKNNNQLNMAITAIMNYVTNRLFEKSYRWETEDQIINGSSLSTLDHLNDNKNKHDFNDQELSSKIEELLANITEIINSCTNEEQLEIVQSFLLPVHMTLKAMRSVVLSANQSLTIETDKGEKIVTEKSVPNFTSTR